MLTFGQKKLLWAAILSISTAAIVSLSFYLGLFNDLELKTFDLRTRLFRAEKKHHPDITVILIDEASLKAMNPIVGRWPWPRYVHAEIIDFLMLSGARAIVFDILFTENERVFGTPKHSLSPNDLRLIESTASAGNVYHAAQILLDSEDEFNKSLLNKPLPQDYIDRFSVKGTINLKKDISNNYYIPFAEIYRASKGIGVVEFSPDKDGVFRRTKLFRYYQGNFYPVLSIALAMDILKPKLIEGKDKEIVLKGISGNDVKNSTISIPLQEDGSYLINMYDNFMPYSISGIIASIQKIKMGQLKGLPVNPEEFKDKVVFIGASAVGVEDIKHTSINSRAPGVYLHASALSNILLQDFLKTTGKWVAIFSIFFLSTGVVVVIIWVRSISYQIMIPFLFAFIYIFIVFLGFRNNIVFQMAPPLSAIGISCLAAFAYLSFTEGKDKRKIKKMLSQYVSPDVLAYVMDRAKGDVLKAEVGSDEYLTVLFSDIRGFTTLSETVPADKVVEMLNQFFSAMSDAVFKYNGTVDKFIGDAIMAFWGAPIKTEDHAEQAVRAACEMIKKLKELNDTLSLQGYPAIRIGIGINTGKAILGNIGSERKLNYTVVGDTVNLASRVEGFTKEYGCNILITENTYRALKGNISCREIGEVKAKGKTMPVRVYEVIVNNGN